MLQSDRFLQALGVPGMKQSSDVAPVFVCVSRRWNFVIPSSSSLVFNLKRRCSYSLKVGVGVESIVAAAKPPKSAVIAGTTTARTSSLILHMAAVSVLLCGDDEERRVMGEVLQQATKANKAVKQQGDSVLEV